MTDNTAKKIEQLQKADREISINDCPDCFTVPGDFAAIDIVHPFTGRGVYPGETLQEIQARYPGAVVMTIDKACEEKAKLQRTPITWEPSTYEAFDYGLCVLPPAIWIGGAFMVGEPYDHDAGNGQPRFQAYRERGDIYERASRPMTRAEFREIFSAEVQT